MHLQIKLQNSYEIYDSEGNMIHQMDDFEDDTDYFDTLELENGCYELIFNDSGEDGLSFWYYPEQGTGYVRFFNPFTNQVAKAFPSDFGKEIRFQFIVDLIPLAVFDFDPSIPCVGESTTFINESYNIDTYHWDFGDGNTSNEENPSHIYDESGEYDVKLIAYGLGSSDTLIEQINVLDETFVYAGEDVTIIEGESVQLHGEGGTNYANYLWSPSTGLSCTYCQNPVADPTTSTTYTVKMTDKCNESYDSVYVEVWAQSIFCLNTDNSIKILPNPNKGSFKIDFGNLSVQNAELKIFTITGQVISNIYYKEIISKQLDYDLQKCEKGIYYLQIRSNELNYYAKMVVN